MRLTVLGSAGTHIAPGRMCSGYLVEHDGFSLLLDVGNGSLANLQRCCDVADVDALLVSHLHPDHFADVYSLYYALRFHERGPQSVTLLGPHGTRERIARLLPEDSMTTFDQQLPARTAAAGDVVDLGPFSVTLFEAYHLIETLASRIEVDGKVIAYTADSDYSPALVHCARDADLLVADATRLERQGPFPAGIHMSGALAGQVAHDAGVARLVPSHVVPANDPDEVAAEAAGVFDGEVLAARDLLAIDLA